MKMHWSKNQENEDVFYAAGQIVGHLRLSASQQSAVVTLRQDQARYTFKRTGFWKNQLLVTDAQGREIIRVRPRKRWGSSWVFTHQDQVYELRLGNRPLAAFCITQQQKPVLCYALDTQNHSIGLRIEATAQTPELFHFLLWFLCRPIWIEQTGADAAFLLMTVS